MQQENYCKSADKPWRREGLTAPLGALLADIQTPDDVEITLRRHSAQIIQKATPAADHHQQATPTSEILLVLAQMLGELADPCRQDGDLNFGRTGVAIAPAIFPDECLLALSGNSHRKPRFLCFGRFLRPAAPAG